MLNTSKKHSYIKLTKLDINCLVKTLRQVLDTCHISTLTAAIDMWDWSITRASRYYAILTEDHMTRRTLRSLIADERWRVHDLAVCTCRQYMV